MDHSKANPREYQRQAIDAKIKSLKEAIRALRHRRNALAPVSSLPTEVIAAIFSFVRLPGPSPLGGEPDNPLAWLRVAHVCRQWRETALDLPLFWSHIDFTTVSPAGATELLSRARMAPLYLKAKVPLFLWDGARFSAFQQELQTHVSHICHLSVIAESFELRRTLRGLTSPAPLLEYLSLSRPILPTFRVTVPETLFDGTTPRLSCLKLCKCDISWKSPLLKGLNNLEMLKLSESARPGLAVWLDALDEMPQLKTLVLHSASPIAPPIPFDVERTVTLPSLTHIDISASAGDCGLALAHLILPALTWLCLTAKSRCPNGSDVQQILPYVARHAHGPQDTRPLQSVLIHGVRTRADILAWPVPDIDVEVDVPLSLTLPAATLSARVAFSVMNKDWFISNTHIDILDAAMAALPLDSLVTLTAQDSIQLDEQLWLHHAPRWSLLQRVRLAPPSARGFREMLLLQDNAGSECPLLPSLTKLDLTDDSALSARRTLRLCDALMKRVEQGVPLEALDLRTCLATDCAIQLLSEIVVDVWGPEETHRFSTWDSGANGLFVPDENSGAEDYSDVDDEDDPYTSDDVVDGDSEEEEYYHSLRNANV